MTLSTADLPRVGRLRAFCLYEQSADEARLARRLAARLRRARAGAHLDRQQLAAGLRVDVELLVAMENSYGSPRIVARLVEAAVAYCERHGGAELDRG
jgi:hypothetical protein